MSIALMSAVFALPVDEPGNTTDRFVLLALADNASDQGVCWPRIATVAAKVALAHVTVRQSVARLADAGWLTKNATVRADGGNGALRYTLNVERLTGHPVEEAPPDAQPSGAASARHRTPRCSAIGAEEPSCEPLVEPSPPYSPPTAHIGARSFLPGESGTPEGLTLTAELAVPHEPDLFVLFYEAYPRKIAPDLARRAFDKAMKRDGIDPIRAGLKAWRTYWRIRDDAQFIPHPSTWLNQRHYLDEPPPIRPKPPKGMDLISKVMES